MKYIKSSFEEIYYIIYQNTLNMIVDKSRGEE